MELATFLFDKLGVVVLVTNQLTRHFTTLTMASNILSSLIDIRYGLVLDHNRVVKHLWRVLINRSGVLSNHICLVHVKRRRLFTTPAMCVRLQFLLIAKLVDDTARMMVIIKTNWAKTVCLELTYVLNVLVTTLILVSD